MMHPNLPHPPADESPECLLRQLQTRRGLLEAVLQQMPAAVIIAEAPSGRLLLANDTVSHLLGDVPWDLAHVEQFGKYQGIHPDGAPLQPREWPLARSILHGEVVMGEDVIYCARDGSRRIMHCNSAPIRNDEGQIMAGILVFHDITERRRAEDAQRFLVRASEMLAVSLDYEHTLTCLVRLAVPILADWCVLDIVGEDGQIQRLAAAHANPEQDALVQELLQYPPNPQRQEGVPRVLRTGRSVRYEEISRELLAAVCQDAYHEAVLTALIPRSAMIVPLLAHGRVLGAISFVLSDAQRRYGPADLALAEDLARHAATAIENAQLYRQAQAELAERTRVEAAQQRLWQERLALLESTGQGIFGVDTQGNCTFINRACADMLGFTPEEVQGKSMHQLAHHHRADGSPYPFQECPVYHAVRSGEATHVDAEVVWRKDGTPFVAEYSVAPVVVAGRLEGAVVALTDITERRRAAEALRAAHEQTVEILESITDAFYTIDADSRFTYINRRAEQLWGMRREDLLGCNMWEVFPQAVGSASHEAILRAMATRQPVEFEAISPVVHQWIGAHVYPSGTGLAVYFRDITARKRVEAERERLLRQVEAERRRLEAVLEQIPVSVIIADVEHGRFCLWNDAAAQVFGERVVGGHIAQFRNDRYQQANGQPYPFEELPLLRALRGEVTLAEEVVICQDGESRMVLLCNAAPIFDEDGQIVAAVLVAQDITQRKTTEQLKDEFMSLAAHELKTPLTAIKGHCQVLMRSLARRRSFGALETQMLETINERTNYVTSLVNELLDLSRIETGRLQLRLERVDLAALLQEVVAQQRVLHPDYEVVLEGGDGAVTGAWDRGRIEQVFTNLLDNAIKYSPPGREVRVTLARDYQAEEVAVTVQDRGIGIPRHDLPYLFGRHYRASNVGGALTGLGLGLYLSSQIVQRHGGRIWAESVEGEGSMFHVVLPLAGPAAGM